MQDPEGTLSPIADQPVGVVFASLRLRLKKRRTIDLQGSAQIGIFNPPTTQLIGSIQGVDFESTLVCATDQDLMQPGLATKTGL